MTSVLDIVLRHAEVVLGASVGPHDNFFGAGGDSLSAVDLCEAVSSELGVDIPLESLFDSSTLAGFADTADRDI